MKNSCCIIADFLALVNSKMLDIPWVIGLLDIARFATTLTY